MEIGIQDIGLFIISGLLLNITPGPDSLLVMARSASQGWRAGAVASCGIGAGIVVHVVAAAAGLSAVVAASEAAFTVIKWGGAAYIFYLGIGMLRSRPAPADAPRLAPATYGHIFMQGFLTDVLNPKVAVFFMAFVPQFIRADTVDKATAMLALGLIFDINCMMWFLLLAATTAFASRRMQLQSRIAVWLKRVTGSLFVVLGLRLAILP